MKTQLYTLGLAVIAAAILLVPSSVEACSGCGCSLPPETTVEEPVEISAEEPSAWLKKALVTFKKLLNLFEFSLNLI